MNAKYTNRLRIIILISAVAVLSACVRYDSVDVPMEGRAYDSSAMPAEKMREKKKIFFHYLNGQSQLSEMESTLKARQIQHQLNEEGGRFPADYFAARLKLAIDYANYDYDKKNAHKNAHRLFNELLADETLSMEQQIKVRTALAKAYIFTNKDFKPEGGKDVIVAVQELSKDYADHPDLSQKDWFDINYALVYMYCHSARISNMSVDEGRAEAIRICNKMLANTALTDAQRKVIDKGLAIFNKPDSNPEELFAFEQK